MADSIRQPNSIVDHARSRKDVRLKLRMSQGPLHDLMPHLHVGKDVHTCRRSLVAFLSSKTVSLTMSILLLLDLMAVIGEMMILGHQECHVEIECGHGSNVTHTEGLMPGCHVITELELPHDLHVAEMVCMYVSLTILTTFALELLLMLIGMGCGFIRQPLLVLDIIVVYISLVVEIVFKQEEFQEIVVILIISRMWRFVRIFHAMGMTMHEVEEHRFEDKQHEIEEHNDEVMEEMKEEKSALEAKLARLSIKIKAHNSKGGVDMIRLSVPSMLSPEEQEEEPFVSV